MQKYLQMKYFWKSLLVSHQGDLNVPISVLVLDLVPLTVLTGLEMTDDWTDRQWTPKWSSKKSEILNGKKLNGLGQYNQIEI